MRAGPGRHCIASARGRHDGGEAIMARPGGVPLRALGSRGAVPAAAASLVLCMRAPSPSPPKDDGLHRTAPRRAAFV